jgi:AAA domain
MMGIPQDPHVLAEKLGVDLKVAETTTGAKAQTNGHAGTGERAETQPVNLNQYPMVRAALDKVTGDRSRDINRIVAACYDAGLTLAQARWCVDRRVNLVDKLDENPKRDDVLECWLKIDEDRRTRKAEASAPHDDRVITLVPASAIVSDIPDWVWEYENRGRIQRGVLTLFAGRPAAGKSTGARWFAAQFSHGNLDGCWKGKPQKIAYIGSEESREYVVKPGLQVAGANINNFVFPKVEMKGEVVSLSSDEDEHKLTKKLLEEGVTVVFVDPVMATINRKVDIYRNNELRDALAPWVRIAQRINGTVIGIVHLVKGTSADVIGSVNGSSAFGEVARCVFGFAKDPEHKTQRVMSQVKNSCGPEDLSLTYEIEATLFTADTGRKGQMSIFKMGDESDITVGEILDAGRGKRRPTSPEMQRVIEFVNSRANTDAAAVYEAGLANSQKVASNMLERASTRGLIAKKDRGVFVKSSVGAASPRTTDEKMK